MRFQQRNQYDDTPRVSNSEISNAIEGLRLLRQGNPRVAQYAAALQNLVATQSNRLIQTAVRQAVASPDLQGEYLAVALEVARVTAREPRQAEAAPTIPDFLGSQQQIQTPAGLPAFGSQAQPAAQAQIPAFGASPAPAAQANPVPLFGSSQLAPQQPLFGAPPAQAAPAPVAPQAPIFGSNPMTNTDPAASLLTDWAYAMHDQMAAHIINSTAQHVRAGAMPLDVARANITQSVGAPQPTAPANGQGVIATAFR